MINKNWGNYDNVVVIKGVIYNIKNNCGKKKVEFIKFVCFVT